MIGNMQRYTLSLGPIPADCRELLLQLPVSVPDLGTWYVRGRVTNQEGQAAWISLEVEASPLQNIEPSRETG